MKLTDNEKRDLTRLIEQGKTIPEKYRFILFGETNQEELTWNGKSQEVTNVDLPFQIIEQIDEPRTEKLKKAQSSFDFDTGRQKTGWTNKLIWGDNKYIISSLKNGPMREEIEKQGGIKLIYIDPPFDVQADFSRSINIHNNNFEKSPSILEEIVFRDTWGNGIDSFLCMIYERLLLMRDLLSDDGSIFVHCDYRLSNKIRTILEEVFGKENFVNEIIWKGAIGETSEKSKKFNKAYDSIIFFRKNKDKVIWNQIFQEYSETSLKLYSKVDEKGNYRIAPVNKPGKGGYFYDLGFVKYFQKVVIGCLRQQQKNGLMKEF